MKAKLTTGRKGCVFYDGERELARRGFAMATLQNRAGVHLPNERFSASSRKSNRSASRRSDWAGGTPALL